MTEVGLERSVADYVVYYPEEFYTRSEAASLLGVSIKEVKRLIDGDELKSKRNKIRGSDTASYLVSHGELGFERLRTFGYKGSNRDIAFDVKSDVDFFPGCLSLDELITIAVNQGIRVPDLNGDRREAKLALTAILAIAEAENKQANFKQILDYCSEKLPYLYVARKMRTKLSGLLNKQLKEEGLIIKRNGTYYLNR